MKQPKTPLPPVGFDGRPSGTDTAPAAARILHPRGSMFGVLLATLARYAHRLLSLDGTPKSYEDIKSDIKSDIIADRSNYSGQPSNYVAEAYATGTITVPSNPFGKDVYIGGASYTFVTTPSEPFEVAKGSSVSEAAANLAEILTDGNEFTDPHKYVEATSALGVATIVARYPGASGNAIELVSVDEFFTLSGATLEGGVDLVEGTPGFLGRLAIDRTGSGVWTCFKEDQTVTQDGWVNTYNG